MGAIAQRLESISTIASKPGQIEFTARFSGVDLDLPDGVTHRCREPIAFPSRPIWCCACRGLPGLSLLKEDGNAARARVNAEHGRELKHFGDLVRGRGLALCAAPNGDQPDRDRSDRRRPSKQEPDKGRIERVGSSRVEDPGQCAHGVEDHGQ